MALSLPRDWVRSLATLVRELVSRKLRGTARKKTKGFSGFAGAGTWAAPIWFSVAVLTTAPRSTLLSCSTAPANCSPCSSLASVRTGPVSLESGCSMNHHSSLVMGPSLQPQPARRGHSITGEHLGWSSSGQQPPEPLERMRVGLDSANFPTVYPPSLSLSLTTCEMELVSTRVPGWKSRVKGGCPPVRRQQRPHPSPPPCFFSSPHLQSMPDKSSSLKPTQNTSTSQRAPIKTEILTPINLPTDLSF